MQVPAVTLGQTVDDQQGHMSKKQATAPWRCHQLYRFATCKGGEGWHKAGTEGTLYSSKQPLGPGTKKDRQAYEFKIQVS